MKHLPSGILRQALDEPQSLLSSARRHLEGCSHCEHRSTVLGTHAKVAAAALGSSPDNPRSFAATAIVAARASRPPVAFWSACAAAAIVALFFATPLRTVAQSLLRIFEPTSFAALPISPADEKRLRTLPDLSRYGTMRRIAPDRRAIAASGGQAASLAQIPVRVPSGVPPTAGSASYEVLSRQTSAFTFSAAKVAAAAKAAGRQLPVMPSRLDGTTLQTTVGPAVIAIYGTPRARARALHHHGSEGRWPRLMVVQMPIPTVVSSNGVSAATILDYLTAQPGMPPQIVAELHAIAEPTSTLPIPFAIDRMHAEPVSVQHANGLAVGDNTGLGAGVIWQRGGYVFGVAGAYPMQTILDIANSLH